MSRPADRVRIRARGRGRAVVGDQGPDVQVMVLTDHQE